MTHVSILKNQLAGLSVEAALKVLIQRYRMDHKTVVWDGQTRTLLNLLRVERELLDMPCKDFGVLRFFGGPPEQGRWYDGTVLSLLCDAVLFEESVKGYSFERMLSA